MNRPSTQKDLNKARVALASAYQAVGALSGSTGTFTMEPVQDLLDMLSQWEEMDIEQLENFLPWPKTPLPENRADDLERAIYEEPELPDDMPEEMWQALRTFVLTEDRIAAAELLRIVVRQTKDGIRKRSQPSR